jgi:hypothetical protein
MRITALLSSATALSFIMLTAPAHAQSSNNDYGQYRQYDQPVIYGYNFSPSDGSAPNSNPVYDDYSYRHYDNNGYLVDYPLDNYGYPVYDRRGQIVSNYRMNNQYGRSNYYPSSPYPNYDQYYDNRSYGNNSYAQRLRIDRYERERLARGAGYLIGQALGDLFSGN